MEKKLLSKFLTLSLLLLPFLGKSQEWEPFKEIKLRKSPTAYTVDFQGNFYLGFIDGSLIKYDVRSAKQENFSLPNTSSISLIDVQNNLKPFIFYFDIQQIIILDRFSTVPKLYPLSEFNVQIVAMTCPAPDGDFWVVENNPLRLKKINPLRKNALLEVQVSLGDSIQKMQAYQNLLIICDENGIHAFDQFGSFLYKVVQKGLTNFQFDNGYLLAFTKDSYLKIDPFKGQLISDNALPRINQGAFFIHNKLGTIKKDVVTIYKPR